MIKMLAAIRRRPGLTRAEFHHYILHTHGSLAAAKPLGVRHYVQNHVDDAVFGDPSDKAYAIALPRDNVTELYFADIEGLQATFADPYSRTVIGPDGARFNDFPTALAMLTEEAVLETTPASGPAVKAMQFVKAADGLAPDDFRARWQAAHQDAAADSTALHRAVLSHRLAAGDAALAHFGRNDTPRYDAVASLWFDAADPVAAFRAHAAKVAADDLVQPSLGFVLFVREISVFGAPLA